MYVYLHSGYQGNRKQRADPKRVGGRSELSHSHDQGAARWILHAVPRLQNL
jgi:hypothetical protein